MISKEEKIIKEFCKFCCQQKAFNESIEFLFAMKRTQNIVSLLVFYASNFYTDKLYPNYRTNEYPLLHNQLPQLAKNIIFSKSKTNI